MLSSLTGRTMTNGQLKREIGGLFQTYLDLGGNAAILVRQMKKTPSVGLRNKLIGELRNIDKKRMDLLNQIDDLSK
jgi:hypothetical protein